MVSPPWTRACSAPGAARSRKSGTTFAPPASTPSSATVATTRSADAHHPSRRGRLPERASTRLWSRASQRSFRGPVRSAVEVRGAAARGLDRRRDDPVDRVPAWFGAVRDGPGHGHHLATGRSRRWRSSARSSPVRFGRSRVDTSSRTSAGLLQVLCAETLGIDPEFVPMPPDAEAMLARCDAALIIGDPALYLDHAARGLRKIDLGDEWTRLTRLPFVWAFWAGRPGALSREAVAALTARARRRRRRVRCDRRRLLRPGACRARPGLLERQYPLHPRRAGRSRPSPLLRAGRGARHRRSRGSAGNLLRRAATRRHRGHRERRDSATGGETAERRPARPGRGARAVRPRADAAPRTAGRRHAGAKAPRPHRHLHHRPQRQLHQRLRRPLQLLRVLPPGRID